MSMSGFTDETLMAFADCELDPLTAARVADAAEQSAEVAAKIALYNASSQILQEAFAPLLDDPVPAHLVLFVESLGANAGQAAGLRPGWLRGVADRVARHSLPASSMARVAASVAAVFVVWGAWRLFAPSPASDLADAISALPAELRTALDRAPSGTATTLRLAERPVVVLPLASYLRSGGVCRVLEVKPQDGADPRPLDVLACRTAGRWQVAAVAERHLSHPDPDAYVPAGGQSDLAAGRHLGTPLAADLERQALECAGMPEVDPARPGQCPRE